MKTQTILIDVDTQHDFCAPNGALFVKGADLLAEKFRALTNAGLEHNLLNLASVDSHAFDAWEFAGAVDAGPIGERPGFPPHCVKGTAGWLKVSGTMAPRARFVPNAAMSREAIEAIATKQAPQQILLEKEVYSLFANPNAATLLDVVVDRARAPRFIVYGVALDYCVKAATIGLLDWITTRGAGGEVWLVGDATASVFEAGGVEAQRECVAKGAKVVDTAAALLSIAQIGGA